jgi:hypothetical protein
MNPNDPDDRFDALLRDSMHREAETVMPAGDGLSKIQQRVTTRRSRARWTRPAFALGTAAIVAVVGVGAYAVTRDNGKDVVDVGGHTPNPTPTQSSLPTPSATTAVPVPAAAFPRLALYPFTTAAAAKSWQRGYSTGGHMSWVADAKQVAQGWIANYVQQPGVDQLLGATYTPTGDRAVVTLGRTMTAESHSTVPVTKVHLVRYGDAWIVTGATDAGGYLKISAPMAGATVTSPVTVSGPAFGSDEAAQIEVRGATHPTVYGSGHASWGGGVPWSANVSFATPSESVGMVTVVEASMADGGPSRIAVLPVRFATTSTAGSMPTYFYGIKNGRVTKFHSSDGSSVDYLTDPQPGGGASDPQLSSSGEQVYYLSGGGTCANGLFAVSTATADNTPQPQSIASPNDGYVITGYAIGPVPSGASGAARPALAYFEQACDGASPAAKLVMTNAAGQRHVIKFASMPPTIVGDPSWEPGSPSAWDVRYLDAVVRGGTQNSLVRYDAMSDTSPTSGRSACPGYDANSGLATALQTDVDGVVWFATQTGSSMQVEKCMAGGNTAVVAFTIAGNGTPADIAVSSDGAVLVTDTNGKVWRWGGSGSPVELTPSVPQTQITW